MCTVYFEVIPNNLFIVLNDQVNIFLSTRFHFILEEFLLLLALKKASESSFDDFDYER